MSGIVLYHSIASRAFVPLWLLEELGIPYRIASTNISKGEQKAPGYLRVNPMGKVPALDDGGVIVTEVPAICIYLADKYSYGTLAPKIDDPRRGPYLKWMVFSTAVFEPAAWLLPATTDKEASGIGWGKRDTVFGLLEDALTPGPYLLGENFSAADVALGGIFTMAMFNKKVPERPAFVAYNDRIGDRPAAKRSGEITWPPELFQQT
jgi:glutathione S-transferase